MNITSVARNNHMPSVPDSSCCSRSLKWWATCPCPCESTCVCISPSVLGECGVTPVTGRDGLDSSGTLRLHVRVVVRLLRDDRGFLEVLRDRRAFGLPFKAGRLVRVRAGVGAPLERPEEIAQRQRITDRQD